MRYNEFKQPIGEEQNEFKQAHLPNVKVLEGQYCRLEKLAQCHIQDLFNYFSDEADAPEWTYLPDEQPHDFQAFENYIDKKINSTDPYFSPLLIKKHLKQWAFYLYSELIAIMVQLKLVIYITLMS